MLFECPKSVLKCLTHQEPEMWKSPGKTNYQIKSRAGAKWLSTFPEYYEMEKQFSQQSMSDGA